MAFSEKTVAAVWDKSRVIQGRDPNLWRKDQCGAWMHRDQYNHPASEYGWKIENVSGGGPDLLENLQAFHLNNTFDIGNRKPNCRVTADRDDIAAGQRVDVPRNTGVM